MTDVSKIFSVPKDYDEIVDKLAFINFCILVGSLYLLDAGTNIISNFVFSSVKTAQMLKVGDAIVGEGWTPVMPSIVLSFFMALVFRIIRLHDFLSDIFGIRRRFDIEKIIIPLALATGSPHNKKKLSKIDKDRSLVMRQIFYLYASMNDPKIDKQLVSEARDYWYWFWVVLESCFVWFLLSAIIFVLSWLHPQSAYTDAGRLLIKLVLMSVISLLLLWKKCSSLVEHQIREIVLDEERKKYIKEYLDAL